MKCKILIMMILIIRFQRGVFKESIHIDTLSCHVFMAWIILDQELKLWITALHYEHVQR